MSSWYVENKWTCSSCGVVNLGRDVQCLKCGSAKESKEKDQLPEDVRGAGQITDPSLLDLAKQGVHWSCQYCGATQRAPDGGCLNCGAGKPRPSQSKTPPERPSVLYKTTAPVKPSSVPPIFAIAIPTLLLALGMWLFLASEVKARVSRTKWIHTAHYEERHTNHGEGWGTPIGAFNKRCTTMVHGTIDCHPYKCSPRLESYRCNPHECNCRTSTSCKDQKNGFSRCTDRRTCSTCYDQCPKTVYSTCYEQCPVYDDWCVYSVYEWVPRGNKTLEGSDPKAMDWPDLGPTDETHRTSRVAAYVVDFQDGSDTYSYDPTTAEQFSAFAVGQQWICEHRRIGQFEPKKLIK